jgi:hypothetical protein
MGTLPFESEIVVVREERAGLILVARGCGAIHLAGA